MELKKIELQNKGMSQDMSISKDVQEHAFKNKNIRIQALDDNTLLSVTNIKGPKKITSITLNGKIVGKCFTKDYLVLFTVVPGNPHNQCYIYRVDLNKGVSSIRVNTLYSGTDLYFELDRTFDTLFFYENKNVQKVYWTESWYSDEELKLLNSGSGHIYINNPPRYINIITEGERNGGNTFTTYGNRCFDFYPDIAVLPKFSIVKDYNLPSELPSGTIQYFISYYFDNGAETLIANSSSIFTIDYPTRGAKADEIGSCGFKLTISNIDTKFDYFRVYSAIRTVKDGPIILKIVGDVKINKTSKDLKYLLIDNGINQETLDASQLYFIGGNPLYASTLDQKDGTLFLGNIKTHLVDIPDDIKEIVDKRKIYYYDIKKKVTNSEGKIVDRVVVKDLPIKWDESIERYITTLKGYVSLKSDYEGVQSSASRPTGLDGKNYPLDKYGDTFFTECAINPSTYGITVGNTLNLKMVESDDLYFTRYNTKDVDSNIDYNKVLGLKNKLNNPYKCISQSPNLFSKYYNYKLQTGNAESSYKTFKGGEMYRFGIQLQSAKGQWTSILWLGDKECTTYPMVDNVNHQISLNNAIYVMPKALKDACVSAGFSNYRIVIADPENQNGRRVQAQGVVCPTLFSPGQRALGIHSISSWIMRPKGMDCSHHHFEPITSSLAERGGEIQGYDVGRVTHSKYAYEGGLFPGDEYNCTDGGKLYTSPYYWVTKDTSNVPRYIITQVSIHSGHKLAIKTTEIFSEYGGDELFWNNGPGYKVIEKFGKQYDEGINGWSKIYNELVKEYNKRDWDTRDLLTIDTMKSIASQQFWGEFLTLFTLIIGIVTLIFGGLAFGGVLAGMVFVSWLVPALTTIGGGIGTIFTDDYIKNCKHGWQKELANKGYIQLNTTFKNAQETKYTNPSYPGETFDCTVFADNGKGLPKEFASVGLDVGQADFAWKEGTTGNTLNAVHFLMIKAITGRSYLAKEIESEYDKFYVDESIVTFHSPEIDNCRNKNLKFKIIGTAPIDASYSDMEVETSTAPYISEGGLDKSILLGYRTANTDSDYTGALYSDFLYWDSEIDSPGGEEGKDSKKDDYLDDHYFTTKAANYKMFMWDKSGSITGGTPEMKELTSDGPVIGSLPSILKTKTLFNQLNSFGNNYFDDTDVKYNPSRIKIFDPTNSTVSIQTKNQSLIYKGNYDHLITHQKALNLHVEDHSKIVVSPATKNTVRIKFNSSPHAVFDLNASTKSTKSLLPAIGEEVVHKGVLNQKDNETHVWVLKEKQDHPVDSCWTSTDDWEYNDAFFTLAVKTDFNIYGNTNTNIFEAIETYLDTKGEYVMSMLQYACKKRGGAYIGLISFKNSGAVPDIALTNAIKQKALKGEFREGTRSVTVNSSYNNGTFTGTVECVAVKLTDIDIFEETDNNGKHVRFGITPFSAKGKILWDGLGEENYFIYEDSFSHGRFKWRHDGIDLHIGFPITYKQMHLDAKYVKNYKYLFVGELYYDLKPHELYNGYSNMDNLLWYPVSGVTPLGEHVEKTFGDTYYQRWDCLKTYPTTEEDTNKVVDITSFMVESHKNLDERTDLNRDFYNLMSRPSNFNLFNPVYDFKNNLFQYTIPNSELSDSEYPNQITWTLKKNFLGKVDTWTNAGLSTVTSCSYPVTKLVNYNNQLLSLNTHSIEVINYNNKNLLASADSTFIELANNSNVDGTTKLYSVYGTHNNSVLITERGLYFIDDNENSIIRFSLDGSISKLGMSKMDSWLKNNLTPGSYTPAPVNNTKFHLEYDFVHKDIYIIGNNICLVYNEPLDAFTSFVEYKDLDYLFNINSSILALAYDAGNPNIYEMFEGNYNRNFDNSVMGYSVHYRVNPYPYNDKVFTNVEFIADLIDSTSNSFNTPFDTIRVWNEFQDTGVQSLSFLRNTPSNLKQKYRVWRADIPRDAMSKYKRDRIRNPWINLELSKSSPSSTEKLELHNMKVQYMI